MILSDVKEILHAEVIVGNGKLDTPIKAGAGSDLMSDLLWGATTDVVLLTGLNNLQVIRSSVISGVAAVVLVRGKRPNADVIAQALQVINIFGGVPRMHAEGCQHEITPIRDF